MEVEARKIGLRMNADKTKLLAIGLVDRIGQNLQARKDIAEILKFCYLGRVISLYDSCDKDIKTRLSNANSQFWKINTIWKSKVKNIRIKIHLYV